MHSIREQLQKDRHHPTSVGLVVNVFAATVFAILMVAFWWVIASEEMSNAVQRKAKVLVTAHQHLEQEPLLRDLSNLLNGHIQRMGSGMKHTKASKSYRNYQNQNVTMMWMLPVVSAYAGLLLAAITFNLVRTHCVGDHRSLSFGHWAGILFVFFGYIPEILFLLFVIEWNVPIGDYEMLQRTNGFR